MIKGILSLLCLACGASGLSASAKDLHLDPDSSNAYVLERGVLQGGVETRFASVDMGDAVGADVSSANGVGRYQDLEGRVHFGLSQKHTLSFTFGNATFVYQDKEAEVGHQAFRWKYGWLVDHPTWGFASVEAKWFRHSANDLTVAGVTQAKSNVLQDYGYGIRFANTRNLSENWDLHGQLGYEKALEDGDDGQSIITAGFGLAYHWGANQLEGNLVYRDIQRKDPNPLFGQSDSDDNTSISLAYSRMFTERLAGHLKASYQDNLFRGIWPFLDREMGNVNVKDYGYVSIGFSYRTRY